MNLTKRSAFIDRRDDKRRVEEGSDKQKTPYEVVCFFSCIYLHSQLYKGLIVKELMCDIKQVEKKNKETYLEAMEEYKRTKEEEAISQKKEEDELMKLHKQEAPELLKKKEKTGNLIIKVTLFPFNSLKCIT